MTESRFGTSGGFVDVDGDGIEDLVIGAPEASGSPKKGAILAYLGTADGISTTAAWEIMGEESGDNFGFSFANLGDVDGDGSADFAAGALYAAGATPFSGNVTVYQGGDSAPAVLGRLNGTQPHGRFGYAVAGGDLNADGYSDVIVSALHASGDAFQSGIVYVYLGGSDLSSTPSAVIKGDHPNHGLGFSLETGDINGDGTADLFVGAHDAVFIYYGGTDFIDRLGADTTPDVTIYGTSETGGRHSGSGFGDSIAFIGDVNNDGVGDVAIANPNRTWPDVYDNIGSVYLFAGSADLPPSFYESDPNHRLAKITGDAAGDRFGSALAVIKDVNDGGLPDLLVSAPWASGGPSDSMPVAGKVYLFHTEAVMAGSADNLDVADAAGVYTMETPFGEFGKVLGACSDGNFFTSAPQSNQNSGMAYAYDLRAGSSTEIGNH
ncbi:MAG: integrin alpha [Desulfosarcinaceae bacterium]|nr:integrin alpha [Desulfosarcinaceae bacterium]